LEKFGALAGSTDVVGFVEEIQRRGGVNAMFPGDANQDIRDQYNTTLQALGDKAPQYTGGNGPQIADGSMLPEDADRQYLSSGKVSAPAFAKIKAGPLQKLYNAAIAAGPGTPEAVNLRRAIDIYYDPDQYNGDKASVDVQAILDTINADARI